MSRCQTLRRIGLSVRRCMMSCLLTGIFGLSMLSPSPVPAVADEFDNKLVAIDADMATIDIPIVESGCRVLDRVREGTVAGHTPPDGYSPVIVTLKGLDPAACRQNMRLRTLRQTFRRHPGSRGIVIYEVWPDHKLAKIQAVSFPGDF